MTTPLTPDFDRLLNTAQEFSAPLAHIQRSVKQLRRHDANVDARARTRLLKAIEREADRIARLVDALLTESR